MKTISKLFVFAFVLFAGAMTFAQSKEADEAFFIGKWKLMVYGLPNGDTPMVLKIQKIDGVLTGTIGDGGANDNKLSKVVINKNTLETNFIGGGYNVPMYLDKKSDNEVEGSMNDMFDVKGTKEEDKK